MPQRIIQSSSSARRAKEIRSSKNWHSRWKQNRKRIITLRIMLMSARAAVVSSKCFIKRKMLQRSSKRMERINCHLPHKHLSNLLDRDRDKVKVHNRNSRIIPNKDHLSNSCHRNNDHHNSSLINPTLSNMDHHRINLDPDRLVHHQDKCNDHSNHPRSFSNTVHHQTRQRERCERRLETRHS